MVRVIWWLGLSIASGIAYMVAGKGGFPNAKLIRRLLCSLLALCLFLALKGLSWGSWWAYLAFWGLNYGALSTYHDYLSPDGTSENWLCWLITGLVYGLAAIPLIWIGITWWLILIRAGALGITIMWLRERTGKAWLEELGSGFLYTASIPLLLI